MTGDRLWPAGISAVLIVTVAANGVLFWAAARGDGNATEPDYYHRAVAWDSTMALERASRALGWRLDATLAAPGGDAVRGELAVEVRDSTGTVVSGASVSVEGFAVAHARSTVRARLGEREAGRYALDVPIARPEWFEFRLLVVRGADRFSARVRCLPGQGCRPA